MSTSETALASLVGLGVHAAEIQEEQAKLRAQVLELEAERARLAKEVTGLRLQAGRFKAKIDQQGPVSSVEEAWLMSKSATIECQRVAGRAPVRLILPRRPVIRAQTIQAAVAEGMRKYGDSG